VDEAPRRLHPLPSNGWTLQHRSKLTRVRGPFHAEMTTHGARAWLGEKRPTLWPVGVRVRFNPTELIGPDGVVVAREGEMLMFLGAGFPVDFDVSPDFGQMCAIPAPGQSVDDLPEVSHGDLVMSIQSWPPGKG
jgi:hypothetical protein